MYLEKTTKQYVVLGLLFFALAFASLFLLTLESKSEITGHIVAQGGNISRVDISQEQPLSYWTLIYGDVNLGGITQDVILENQVIQRNVSGSNVSSPTAVIGFLQSSFNSSDVAQVHPNIVDAMLGISTTHHQSVTNTFNQTYDFIIGNDTHTLYAAQTNAVNGSYVSGVFLSNATLGFVTQWINGTGFDNTTIGFQLFLPINQTQTVYFYAIPGDNLTTVCTTNFSTTAYMHTDNLSVVVDWEDVIGATGYELYFADGLNGSNYIEFNESNKITGILTSQYIDTNASVERYYRPKAILGAGDCFSNETAATFFVNLSFPDSNLVSFPLEFRNRSVAEVLRPITPYFTSLNEYDNAAQTYNFYIQFSGSIFSNFNNISLGRGYWLTLNATAPTYRMAGRVIKALSEPVYNASNLLGFPVIEGNNSVAYTLRSIDGNYSVVNEYDNELKTYSFYIIFGGSVFQNFNTIKPVRGYWITVNETDTITLP